MMHCTSDKLLPVRGRETSLHERSPERRSLPELHACGHLQVFTSLGLSILCTIWPLPFRWDERHMSIRQFTLREHKEEIKISTWGERRVITGVDALVYSPLEEESVVYPSIAPANPPDCQHSAVPDCVAMRIRGCVSLATILQRPAHTLSPDEIRWCNDSSACVNSYTSIRRHRSREISIIEISSMSLIYYQNVKAGEKETASYMRFRKVIASVGHRKIIIFNNYNSGKDYMWYKTIPQICRSSECLFPCLIVFITKKTKLLFVFFPFSVSLLLCADPSKKT